LTLGRLVLEKVEPSSSGDDDSSDGDPDFSSDKGDPGEAEQDRSCTNKEKTMVRPGRAALAGIQENWEWSFSKFPRQDPARNTYALEHDPAQS
jgi:hypothetical protein